jgi:drug/metabolite transporter (DMT)-like permease
LNEPNHALGQFCALAAAATWAVGLILFKVSGERMPPLALNLFKSCVAILLFAVTITLIGGLDYFDLLARIPLLRDLGGSLGDSPVGILTGRDWFALFLSGVVGIAIADTLFFAALNRVGVGIVVVVEGVYSPSTIFFAWLMLGEHPLIAHYLGGALIIGALVVSSRHTPPEGRTRRDIIVGVLIGATGMACMAYGIVVVKPVVEQNDVIWITVIRLFFGILGIVPIVVARREARATLAAFGRRSSWSFGLPAAFFGNYLALTFWVAGYKYTEAAVAAILNQTSIVFAAILARLFLRERLGPRKLAAIGLAIVGVIIIIRGPAVDALIASFF